MLVVLFAVLLCSSCSDGADTNSNAEPVIKKGVAPIADLEIAVIEMEDSAAFGTIQNRTLLKYRTESCRPF